MSRFFGKAKKNVKRDIIRFTGQNQTAVNLQHVANVVLDKKRITFTFYNTNLFIDYENEETAKDSFEQILTVWGGDVVE